MNIQDRSMTDDDDRAALVPAIGAFEYDYDRRFAELMRKAGVDPEVREFMWMIRERMNVMQREARDFVPRHEIERIADARTDRRLKALGFDVEHISETSAQVAWLMGLKRSVRGFGALLGVSFVGMIFTLTTTYITSHWSK